MPEIMKSYRWRKVVDPAADLLHAVGTGTFTTIYADPPWRFKDRGHKAAPEHVYAYRYPTLKIEEITMLPVEKISRDQSHLYLWIPCSMLREGLSVLAAWGFNYKTMLVWNKVYENGNFCKGLGYYFRTAIEIVLFGVRGKLRTLQPGRSQVNTFTLKRTRHSEKPSEFYDVIESCSPGPYIELFARQKRRG